MPCMCCIIILGLKKTQQLFPWADPAIISIISSMNQLVAFQLRPRPHVPRRIGLLDAVRHLGALLRHRLPPQRRLLHQKVKT